MRGGVKPLLYGDREKLTRSAPKKGAPFANDYVRGTKLLREVVAQVMREMDGEALPNTIKELDEGLLSAAQNHPMVDADEAEWIRAQTMEAVYYQLQRYHGRSWEDADARTRY